MLNNIERFGLLLGVVGVFVCGYLTYTRIFGGDLVCGLTSCGVVNTSKYAIFLGIPVSFWGLGFYLLVISLILLKKRALLFVLTTLGLLFSIYLTYLEAFVIKAWCQWCILSAWLSVSLFAIALRLRFEKAEIEPADSPN